MMAHDYIKYPELTNKEIEEMPFDSPHQQITQDFYATVRKVHDGDTITLRADFRDFQFPLRLLDIDAPEMNAGGEVARDWLIAKIQGAEVLVEIDNENRVDKWGRLLGRIIHTGMDVAEEMFWLGLVKPFNQRHEGEIIDKIGAYKW